MKEILSWVETGVNLDDSILEWSNDNVKCKLGIRCGSALPAVCIDINSAEAQLGQVHATSLSTPGPSDFRRQLTSDTVPLDKVSTPAVTDGVRI